LLVPVFLVSTIVLTLIVRLIYFISAEPVYQWFVDGLVNIIGVSGSIIVTVIMAPTYRVVVGIGLAVIVLILVGISVGMDLIFYDFEWIYLLEQLALTIGAIVALLHVIYGVKPYEENESIASNFIVE
jgi:hypothetical protein